MQNDSAHQSHSVERVALGWVPAGVTQGFSFPAPPDVLCAMWLLGTGS